jgi:acyl-CoA dehydrogenase
MFTMMNNARLAVGIEGVAVAEAARQKALEYANERRQGKAPGWSRRGHEPDRAASRRPARPVDHDVADPRRPRHLPIPVRMPSTWRASRKAMKPAFWNERASLLTPVAKAFSTDIGSQVASIGVQVHGGMGFIEETGAALYMRDARIAQIYEGTNGIQAIDLVMRKLPQSGGACVATYLDELDDVIGELSASNNPAFGHSAERLQAAMADLRAATEALEAMLKGGDISAAWPARRPI